MVLEMRIIELGDLEIFRAVVREGGVVRAAARLHRVPSNVTTRMQQLQERLGVALLRRHGRTHALTSEGEVLLAYAERLLALADEAEQALRPGAEPRGRLRLGALESAAGSRLPPLLSRLHRACPDLVVELSTGTTAALLARVERYELDAAFVSEPFDAPGLARAIAFTEELVLVTPRDQTTMTRAELAERTLIAFARGCSYRRRVETWLDQGGLAPARVLELASYQAIVACVAAGTGFAVVPKSLLRTLRPGSELRTHPLPARLARSRTMLVWRGHPTLGTEALAALLKAA